MFPHTVGVCREKEHQSHGDTSARYSAQHMYWPTTWSCTNFLAPQILHCTMVNAKPYFRLQICQGVWQIWKHWAFYLLKPTVSVRIISSKSIPEMVFPLDYGTSPYFSGQGMKILHMNRGSPTSCFFVFVFFPPNGFKGVVSRNAWIGDMERLGRWIFVDMPHSPNKKI